MLFPRSLHSSLVSWVIVTVGFVFGGGSEIDDHTFAQWASAQILPASRPGMDGPAG